MKLVFAVVLLFAAVPAWTAEIHTFSLLPDDGSISGAPGETVGWGYSMENQSTTHWLVTAGLVPGSFQFGTPDLIFDFPILAPGASLTVPFDAAASEGLMGLTWDASAPLGAVESGSFELSAEWWNGDPLAGGQFAFGADPLSQSYQATAVVPEPGSGALLGLALLVAGGVAGVRRRRSSAEALR
jgi:hypothetical protein